MAAFQQTIIVGNVGRNPRFQYTQNGVAVCDFSVAVTEKWGKGDSRQEKTTWFKVTAWKELAEICNSYVVKGMPIMAIGTINASAYLNKSDEPTASLELTARTIQFLGSKNGDGAGGRSENYDDDFANDPLFGLANTANPVDLFK